MTTAFRGLQLPGRSLAGGTKVVRRNGPSSTATKGTAVVSYAFRGTNSGLFLPVAATKGMRASKYAFRVQSGYPGLVCVRSGRLRGLELFVHPLQPLVEDGILDFNVAAGFFNQVTFLERTFEDTDIGAGSQTVLRKRVYG